MERIVPHMLERKARFEADSPMPPCSHWFTFKQFKVYLRIGKTHLGYDYVLAVTISNIDVIPRHQRKGVFKKFLSELRTLCVENGYTHIFAENVINEHLRKYLVSLNFEVCPANNLSLYTKL